MYWFTRFSACWRFSSQGRRGCVAALGLPVVVRPAPDALLPPAVMAWPVAACCSANDDDVDPSCCCSGASPSLTPSGASRICIFPAPGAKPFARGCTASLACGWSRGSRPTARKRRSHASRLGRVWYAQSRRWPMHLTLWIGIGGCMTLLAVRAPPEAGSPRSIDTLGSFCRGSSVSAMVAERTEARKAFRPRTFAAPWLLRGSGFVAPSPAPAPPSASLLAAVADRGAPVAVRGGGSSVSAQSGPYSAWTSSHHFARASTSTMSW
mmetsp:Transcript_80177/g.226985  ORF Transcript_80177/g.226985 Transcript_80177/m.226985 type:complete len:266 (+) Transcript_80177:1063-1860(+)